MNDEIIATNEDGDKKVTLYRAASGAYYIKVGLEITVFGMGVLNGFKNFGTQVMFACMRSGKIADDSPVIHQ